MLSGMTVLASEKQRRSYHRIREQLCTSCLGREARRINGGRHCASEEIDKGGAQKKGKLVQKMAHLRSGCWRCRFPRSAWRIGGSRWETCAPPTATAAPPADVSCLDTKRYFKYFFKICMPLSPRKLHPRVCSREHSGR